MSNKCDLCSEMVLAIQRDWMKVVRIEILPKIECVYHIGPTSFSILTAHVDAHNVWSYPRLK